MKPLSEEQITDIEFVKNTLIAEIKKIQQNSDKLKELFDDEIKMSIIHLKFFSAYLQEKKFETIEDAWLFENNDAKGIIQKIMYVSGRILRLGPTKEQRAPGSKP